MTIAEVVVVIPGAIEMKGLRQAFSLFEVLTAMAVIAVVWIGLTSLIYSVRLQQKRYGLDDMLDYLNMLNIAVSEMGKLSLTGRPPALGTYQQIGEGIDTTRYRVLRSRADLDGDGIDSSDPVFLYLERL